jgi:hypothetical protein
VQQLKLPFPIKHSKYNIGLVQGIPTEDSIKGVRVVKGVVKKHNYLHIKEFVSAHFNCPGCKATIRVKTGWSFGLHTRGAKCPKCKTRFCLIFESEPNWCMVCRVRKLECIQKYILLVEVIS